MRARALFSLVGALVAAIALVSASGAATMKVQKIAKIDVSTRAAVVHYLRSIHVNPKGLVIQRGLRNYAGAHCPGTGWICTSTSHPVVQVATAGGTNTFRCSTGRCAAVQVAASASATNTAKCIKVGGLSTQSCTINQSSSSGNNVAIVYQLAVGAVSRTQTAVVNASISQTATGSTNTNTACVSQNVLMDGSTVAVQPVTIALEAHQTVSINQNSAYGGNSAQSSATALGTCDTGHPLTQNQVLNAIDVARGSVTQNENAVNSGPNMTIDVEQNQSAGFLGSAYGPNSANFNQTNSLTAVATTPNGPVSQTQSSVNGGLLGTINQDSRDLSTATATQTETQCEDAHSNASVKCDRTTPDPPAYSLTQTQYGPVHKGVGTATQTGNTGDTFSVSQSSTQDDDQGAGSQQTNVVQGDCSTSGLSPTACTVSQNTQVDGQSHTNTQSGQDVNTSTNCTGSTCTTPKIVFDGSAGTGSPPTTLGGYTMTPFGTDEQPSCDAEGSSVTGVDDPAGTIGFDEALHHDIVGQCWNTWSNGYSGDVYDTVSSTDPASVTISLPSGTQAFDFYAEPNPYDDFTITATAQDGTTSGPVTVNGYGGASNFGFYGVGGATLASITVTADSEAGGFAIGEFGISPATEIP